MKILGAVLVVTLASLFGGCCQQEPAPQYPVVCPPVNCAPCAQPYAQVPATPCVPTTVRTSQ